MVRGGGLLKKILIAGAFLSVGALAWAGATQFSSSAFEKKLVEIQTNPDLPSYLELTVLTSEKGFLQSTGTMRWNVSASAMAGLEEIDLPNKIGGLIHFTMHHSPSPAGLSRFDAEIVADGWLGEMTKRVTFSDILLTVTGQAGFNQQWVSEFKTPKVSWDSDGLNLRIPVTTGTVMTAGHGAIRYNWEMARAAAASTDGNLVISGVSAHGSIQDSQLGTGSGQFSIASLKTKDVGAIGIEFAAETTEVAGKIDTVVTYKLEQLNASGRQFKDLALGFALRGLDVGNVRVIQQTLRDLNADMQRISSDQALSLENAAASLLDKGLSIALTDARGKSDQGEFFGQLQLQLKPAPVQTPFLNRIAASGNARVSQSLLPGPMGQVAMSTGYVSDNGGNYSTSLELANGQLSVNGNQVDAAITDQLALMMQVLDMQLIAWRDGLTRGESMIGGMLPVRN
ncbi:MAG: DUF945 family protein [Burkholderiaceae bacterium]